MEDERQYQNIAHYQQQQQQQQQQAYPRPQYPAHQQQQQQQQRGLLSPVNNRPGGPVQHLRGPSVVQPGAGESPPPPPPPPVSTHPLLAGQAQQAVMVTAAGNQNNNSLWEKEEMERVNAQRRQEAARQWMEEQIQELESIHAGQRTPKQEEQLRALRLESEFRKRAMEAAQEEEDEEDAGASGRGSGQGMLRLVQEDLERARQWRMEKEQQQTTTTTLRPPQQLQPPPALPPTNGHGNMNNNNTSAVPDQERARKIEAFQRKQRELEATQAAEERILREAQRRKQQEDDQVRQQQQWSRPASGTLPSQRLDSLVSGPTNTESAPTGNTKRVSFFQEPTPTTIGERMQREDPNVIVTYFKLYFVMKFLIILDYF